MNVMVFVMPCDNSKAQIICITALTYPATSWGENFYNSVVKWKGWGGLGQKELCVTPGQTIRDQPNALRAKRGASVPTPPLFFVFSLYSPHSFYQHHCFHPLTIGSKFTAKLLNGVRKICELPATLALTVDLCPPPSQIFPKVLATLCKKLVHSPVSNKRIFKILFLFEHSQFLSKIEKMLDFIKL